MKRLACITCGPAFEPIDSVRRITNFATGEIGTILSKTLQAGGWDVICFRGVGSTAKPPNGMDVRSFSTNESLAEALKKLPREPDVIFHAAALCDYVVSKVDGVSHQKKLSSRSGEITLHLKPAIKVLPQLRDWFPAAKIVGWKYELDGSRADALNRATLQIQESRTDACVINGQAYGTGFGILRSGFDLLECPDKSSLAKSLAELF